MKMPNV